MHQIHCGKPTKYRYYVGSSAIPRGLMVSEISEPNPRSAVILDC